MEVTSDLGFPGSRSVKKHKTRIGELSLSVLSVCLLCLAFQGQPVHSYDNRVRKLWLPSGVHLPTDVGGENVIGEWKFAHRRALLATNTSASNFRPLAARDDRLDPFDHFNHYRKGYDIKSKHYWGLWRLQEFPGMQLRWDGWRWGCSFSFLRAANACAPGRGLAPSARAQTPTSGLPASSSSFSPSLQLEMTSVCGLGDFCSGCSVVLFIACKRFTSQAYNVEDVIVGAAQNATDNIHNVSVTLGDVKGIILPYDQDLYLTLNSTETKLNSLAVNVSEKVFVNRKTYQKVFKIIEAVLLVVASSNLLLVVLGFASTFLRWRRFFYFIIVVTWIFTALTYVMFGFFFSVHNLADDTCLAFKQYLHDPQNTTLDDLLPCADLASSSAQYKQVRMAMKDVLDSATDQFLYYTNGSTSLVGVCDPIGPAPDFNYTGICANDTLPVGELAGLVKPFVCNGTRTACLETYPFYVDQSTYNFISAMASASQSTLNALPLLEGLTNCSLVTNPIDTVVNVRCAPAKVAINRIWISLAVLSAIMILLILFWCMANRRNTEQQYLTAIAPQSELHPFDAQPQPYTVMHKTLNP